ncbi:MAG: sugar phosphate nucleotidyltransferase, partial [Bdellovibrionia bacterium]
MKNPEKIKIGKSTPVLEILRVLQKEGSQFVYVVDDDGRLVGTITDGDVRRGLLRGEDLNAPAVNIMRTHPLTVHADMPKRHAYQLMKANKVAKIPVIDKDRRVVGILSRDDFEKDEVNYTNPVVIMAGGLGSRLGDVTSNCPKVLLKMGDKPILQIIIENLKKHGFSNIFLSVNYKSEMIKEYFRSGEEFGVDINYLDENKKLGTAGSLSLLKHDSEEPILVMNGDLLTKVNFSQLLQYHIDEEYDATMCVREYEI